MQRYFFKRKRKEVEKQASVTGFLSNTCLVPALNVFYKENSLNPKRNSQCL